jgi:type II secretory pathway pseudopilin PulG
MDNFGILFILFAVVLLVVAILAAIVGYFWASSTTKSALLKQINEQGDAIRKEAQEQLQNWKDQELSVIRQQTYDAAKGQAIQEMQEQSGKRMKFTRFGSKSTMPRKVKLLKRLRSSLSNGGMKSLRMPKRRSGKF